MKPILNFLMIAVVMVLSTHTAVSQNWNKYQKPSNLQVEAFVKEVFKDAANKEVFNRTSRLEFLTNALQNRVRLTAAEETKFDKTTNLSDVKVFNLYNTSLEKPLNFDIRNFNPLVYDINWYSNKDQFFKIDGSNLILTVIGQYIKQPITR